MSARFPLHGLDPNAKYRVTDLDKPEETKEFTGKELMEDGAPVTINEKPGVAFLVYSSD